MPYVGHNSFLAKLQQPYAQQARPQAAPAASTPPVAHSVGHSNGSLQAASILKNLMKKRSEDPNADDEHIFNEMAARLVGGPTSVASNHADAVAYLRNLVGSVPGPDGAPRPAPIPVMPRPMPKPAPQPQPDYAAQNTALRAANPNLFPPGQSNGGWGPTAEQGANLNNPMWNQPNPQTVNVPPQMLNSIQGGERAGQNNYGQNAMMPLRYPLLFGLGGKPQRPAAR